MATFELEVEYVGQFLAHAMPSAGVDANKLAWRAMDIVRADMLESLAMTRVYSTLTRRFAAGEPLTDPEDFPMTEEPPPEWRAVFEGAEGRQDIINYAVRVRDSWRMHELARFLRLAEVQAERAITSSSPEKARKAADSLAMSLTTLFAHDTASSRLPVDVRGIVEAELAAIDAEEVDGIPVPYKALEVAELGPWMPGDVVGLSAYSNGGKSTLAGNIIHALLRRGYPCVAFPTEMKGQWVARMLAARAGVSQRIVEKRLWKRADDDMKESYKYELTKLNTLPFEVVNRPNITPMEIIASTRVLRRRWPDRPVVVVVDHMHRLDYGGADPNEAVGEATRALKNLAGDEGVVFLLLFQPRKPSVDVYSPIAGHQIRGNSMVWNELDEHISPYRTWVMSNPDRPTDWGTPGTARDAFGNVKYAKPNADGAHLCDDLMFIKLDKRRVGGEGPTVALDFNKDTGLVYERY